MQDTGGIYSVGMSDKHVEECVMDHAPPPPTKASGSAASLVSHASARKQRKTRCRERKKHTRKEGNIPRKKIISVMLHMASFALDY